MASCVFRSWKGRAGGRKYLVCFNLQAFLRCHMESFGCPRPCASAPSPRNSYLHDADRFDCPVQRERRTLVAGAPPPLLYREDLMDRRRVTEVKLLWMV
jgi:hypothetical protein